MINLANKCVLVRTQEEYESVLKEAKRQGYRWYGGKEAYPYPFEEQQMKTKQMAHEQYCKRFEKNKYLEQESKPFKQDILNLKNAIAEYEKENFVEVDESWKILFMKRFQEVK